MDVREWTATIARIDALYERVFSTPPTKPVSASPQQTPAPAPSPVSATKPPAPSPASARALPLPTPTPISAAGTPSPPPIFATVPKSTPILPTSTVTPLLPSLSATPPQTATEPSPPPFTSSPSVSATAPRVPLTFSATKPPPAPATTPPPASPTPKKVRSPTPPTPKLVFAPQPVALQGMSNDCGSFCGIQQHQQPRPCGHPKLRDATKIILMVGFEGNHDPKYGEKLANSCEKGHVSDAWVVSTAIEKVVSFMKGKYLNFSQKKNQSYHESCESKFGSEDANNLTTWFVLVGTKPKASPMNEWHPPWLDTITSLNDMGSVYWRPPWGVLFKSAGFRLEDKASLSGVECYVPEEPMHK